MKPRHTLVACAVAVVLGCGVAQADTKVFASPALLATGSTPRVVVRVDVDGKGPADDLVTANEGTNDLTVFVNDGRGGYDSLRVAAGRRPGRINALDFDNDGRVDLAVLNQADRTVQLLLNDGRGGYVTSNVLPVGAAPDRQLTWKGGALSRLVVSNAEENTITYYAFGNDGAVIGTNTTAVGRRPNAILNLDLDLDGTDELLVANLDDDSVSIVARQSSSAALPTGVVGTVGVGWGPIGTSGAVDLDGDGRRDVVVANRDDNTISILRSRGDRTFDVSTHAVGPAPGSVNIADIDGDGRPDIVTGDQGGSTISVLMNRGAGQFGAAVAYMVGRNPAFPVANDIDGDGAIDLIVPSADGVVTILRGAGNGTFPQTLRATLPSGVTPRGSAQLVAVSGDGNLGIAVALPASHQVAVMPNAWDAYVRVVEFTRKAHDGATRFFITPDGTEIEALDKGAVPGWTRTGMTFRAYAASGPGRAGVCRFYSASLDTHFFTSNAAECETVANEHSEVWGRPESRNAFYVPTSSAAGCPGGASPVYRLFGPLHVSHRNTPNVVQRDDMVKAGWVAEGQGPAGAAMCAP
jgi:hypothetical protein